MTTLPISEERKKLFASLTEAFNKIAEKTDEYLYSFDKKDFFVFSDSDTRAKRYQKHYYAFTISVADHLLAADRLAGELSSLVLRADREMNVDELIILQTVFEAYLEFKKNSSEYFSSAEKMLSSKSISVSVMMDNAMKFKFSATAIIDKLN